MARAPLDEYVPKVTIVFDTVYTRIVHWAPPLLDEMSAARRARSSGALRPLTRESS